LQVLFCRRGVELKNKIFRVMLPNIPKKWSGKLHGFQRHFPSEKSSPDKFSSRESAKSFHPDGRHCYKVTRHCALLYLPLTLYSCLHSFCFLRPASFFLRDLKNGYRFTFGECMHACCMLHAAGGRRFWRDELLLMRFLSLHY
jgi:hypothetical protein